MGRGLSLFAESPAFGGEIGARPPLVNRVLTSAYLLSMKAGAGDLSALPHAYW